MIPNAGHHTPRQRQTVTVWIRLLHVRKRYVSFEEQHKGRQISRLSLNIFLDITGMILICSDIEHLFYLRVTLSVWIPHTKITIEYYDWFIHRTRFVAWFNLSVVTYTTGNPDFRIGHPVWHTALWILGLTLWHSLRPFITNVTTAYVSICFRALQSFHHYELVPCFLGYLLPIVLWFSVHAMDRGDC